MAFMWKYTPLHPVYGLRYVTVLKMVILQHRDLSSKYKYVIRSVNYVIQRVNYVIPRVNYVIPRVNYVIPRVNYVIPRVNYVIPRVARDLPNVARFKYITQKTHKKLCGYDQCATVRRSLATLGMTYGMK
jgi:hypothetical protein